MAEGSAESAGVWWVMGAMWLWRRQTEAACAEFGSGSELCCKLTFFGSKVLSIYLVVAVLPKAATS